MRPGIGAPLRISRNAASSKLRHAKEPLVIAKV